MIPGDYNLICSEIPEYSKFSLKEFSETTMLVSSRTFNVDIDLAGLTMLVPYADMLNHSMPESVRWSYTHEREGFILMAEEDIKRGE